jgi:hypothetical protein
MKYDEYWRVKNSQTSTDDHSTSDLPLTWNDGGTTKHYAEVLFQNEDDWQLQDGWYYYKHALNTDESTSSLLKAVRLNCDANFAGTTTYSPDGQSAQSNPDQYNEATYHLYITFQMLGEQLLIRNRLYDYVADQSVGTDENVSFGTAITDDVLNRVYTVKSSENDEHPIHYYRGYTNNNMAILNGFCFKIFRTAENGSVKMLYYGRSDENATWTSSGYACYGPSESGGQALPHSDMDDERYNLQPAAADYPDLSPLKDGFYLSGYMYNDKYPGTRINNLAGFGFIFGNDVSWDPVEHKYTLIDQYKRDPDTESFTDAANNVSNGQHYTCASETEDTCEEVYYIVYMPSPGYPDTAFLLRDGDKLDDLREISFSNTKDSKIKERVDNWFANYMTNIQDKIEDVVYCNDRTIASNYINYGGALYSKDQRTDYQTFFSPYFRVNVAYAPTYDCPNNARDGFTVSPSRGNGKLTYPVGIMTADELAMSGMMPLRVSGSWSDPHGQSFINNGNAQPDWNFWTMSPSMFSVDGSNNGIDGRQYHYTYDGGWLSGLSYPVWNTRFTKPVIATVYDTYIRSGTGDWRDPLILEF